MEDKRQVVPGLEDNRDVTTTLGVQKAKGGLGKVMGGLGSLLVLVGFVGSNLPLIVGGIVVAVVGAVLGNRPKGRPGDHQPAPGPRRPAPGL